MSNESSLISRQRCLPCFRLLERTTFYYSDTAAISRLSATGMDIRDGFLAAGAVNKRGRERKTWISELSKPRCRSSCISITYQHVSAFTHHSYIVISRRNVMKTAAQVHLKYRYVIESHAPPRRQLHVDMTSSEVVDGTWSSLPVPHPLGFFNNFPIKIPPTSSIPTRVSVTTSHRQPPIS